MSQEKTSGSAGRQGYRRNKQSSTVPVIIFVVLLIIAAGGYLYFQNNYVSDDLVKIRALLDQAAAYIAEVKTGEDPDEDIQTSTELESLKIRLSNILPEHPKEHAEAKRYISKIDGFLADIQNAAKKRSDQALADLEDKMKKERDEKMKKFAEEQSKKVKAKTPAAPAPAPANGTKTSTPTPPTPPAEGQQPEPPKQEFGKWAFQPPKDQYSAEALLDLRTLNEKKAGENGFITRSKDGNSFATENGKPIKFWSLNTSIFTKSGNRGGDIGKHARFIAKRGCNMVRFHGHIPPAHQAKYVKVQATGNRLQDINAKCREDVWKMVAGMKKEGIYITFSPYWANQLPVKSEWGLLNAGKAKTHGLLFFDPKLQEAYKSWLKQLMTETNPHTGIPLSKDPTLAIFQIQNEDSLLFWTSQKIENKAGEKLRQLFGEFCENKYGSLEKAKTAWGGKGIKGDNFSNGEVGLYIIWNLTQPVSNEGQKKRMADQMEFFTMTMYNFNKMIGDYLRNDLGCKQIVNAGNWKTADNVKMLDSERYSYAANEVMAVNRYYTGLHDGKNRGWAIIPGDTFTDESVLFRPRHIPVNLKQALGFPILVTESSWVPPLNYQSEAPFLIAAYTSLSGVDSYYWFATSSENWRQPDSANGYLRPSIGKWVCATPMLMGQWPAAALMFRKGYIKQGDPAVYEERSLEDLWFRKMPIIAEDAGYDPNRDIGDRAPESNIEGGVNPLAFLIGPVIVKYKGSAAKNKVVDLAKYIDEAAKTVSSITNELKLDYGKGICLLNAPKAQGATGFLSSEGTISLDDIAITCENHYATILAVSVDEKDLRESSNILIQVGTRERPTGWRTSPTNMKGKKGERISSTGKAPWQIDRAKITITVKNTKLTKAIVTDVNFMPKSEISLEDAEGGKKFAYPEDALYVFLK